MRVPYLVPDHGTCGLNHIAHRGYEEALGNISVCSALFVARLAKTHYLRSLPIVRQGLVQVCEEALQAYPVHPGTALDSLL